MEKIVLVKDLIEDLKKLDENMNVYLLDCGDSPFEYGYGIKRVYQIESSEDNVTGVYIEQE